MAVHPSTRSKNFPARMFQAFVFVAAARNYFRRHFFQLAGIRYVHSDAELASEDVVRVPPRPIELSRMIDTHYGRFEHLGLANFHHRLVQKAVQNVDAGNRYDLYENLSFVSVWCPISITACQNCSAKLGCRPQERHVLVASCILSAEHANFAASAMDYLNDQRSLTKPPSPPPSPPPKTKEVPSPFGSRSHIDVHAGQKYDAPKNLSRDACV